MEERKGRRKINGGEEGKAEGKEEGKEEEKVHALTLVCWSGVVHSLGLALSHPE